VSTKVLIVGVGDAGSKIADGLARSGRVGKLVLVGLNQGQGPDLAGMLDSCYDCQVKFIGLDCTRQQAVERLLKTEKPDLIVQSGTLLSPWLTFGRSDKASQLIAQAGLGVQLSAQLPIIHTVMRAVREVDFKGPVANLSFPDVNNVILGRFGLAPTTGLGNATIMLLRVRAALRKQLLEAGDVGAELPLIRLIGHHNHIYGAMQSQLPELPEDRCRVYLGEEGRRADELAYQGHPLEVGAGYNVITAAAALAVVMALLPGAAPSRISAPAPLGLPGGYPVKITEGQVELDLPDGVDLEEAKAFHERTALQDGIAGISEDGVVTYSEKAKKAVAGLDPALAEPLSIADCPSRFNLLMSHLNA
jgi:hypothetical protein